MRFSMPEVHPYSKGCWQDSTSRDTSTRQGCIYEEEARSDAIHDSPGAWPNVRSPKTLFCPFYVKFHTRAFLQALKVHLLKTTAVKENLLPIRRTNETKAPVPNDTFDRTLHRHLDYLSDLPARQVNI
jgi:hypothetical protein